jgi:hypothetical protein
MFATLSSLFLATLVAAPAAIPTAQAKMTLLPAFFGKGNIGFLNKDTVQGGFHDKTVWTVWVNSPPAKVDNYVARVEIMLMAFDCAKPAFQIKFVRLFDDNAKLLVAMPSDPDTRPTPADPKSGEGQMERAVCVGIPRGYKPLHSVAQAVAVTKALFKDQPQK